jgi:chromosome segregation ATPase
MPPVNRQEVQNIIEIAKNRIIERVATKQDIIMLSDSIKTLSNLHLQSQQLLKQSEYQRSQLSRRIVALETRISSMDNEIRTAQYMLSKMAGQKQQPTQIVLPATPEQQPITPTPGSYVFRPN